LLINQTVYSNPLQFLTYQREHWYKTFAWPWQGIEGNVRSIGWRKPNEAQMIGVQEVFYFVLGLVGTIAAGLTMRPPYAVWMAGNWLLFKHLVHPQRAALQLDPLPALPTVRPTGGAADLAHAPDHLVDPLHDPLHHPVRTGTLGLLAVRTPP